MDEYLVFDSEDLELARTIFEGFVNFRPEHSVSFILTPEGADVMGDVMKLIEWGIGKNKSKLKDTAIMLLEPILEIEAGEAVNFNLVEYEIKSLREVLSVIEKAIANLSEDGQLKA